MITDIFRNQVKHKVVNPYLHIRRWISNPPSKKIFRSLKYYAHWKLTIKYPATGEIFCYPWLTYGAINWIEDNISDDCAIFEWGSGGSTYYFSKKAKHVYSAEHDKQWYEKVRKKLQVKSKPQKYTLYYINSKKALTLKSKQLPYSKIDPNHNYEKYINAIFHPTLDDIHIDIILVDGRARNYCVSSAIKKLSAGGIIILDNTERKEYVPATDQLFKNDFICKNFKGYSPYNKHVTTTSVYIRK